MRPAKDRRLILQAGFILPVTEIGLRVFGFHRWKELVEKLSPATHFQRLPAVRRHASMRIARAVRSAQLHGPTNPNCLERSMTLWWMLRRAGVEAELQIGARKQGTRFEAHAWVELNGQVLNDVEEVHQHYARFDAPIAAAEEGSRGAGKADSTAAGKAAI